MFWRKVLSNTLGLSIAYAGTGAAIEALRRWHSAEWVKTASHALDSIPARVLGRLGALTALRELWWSGEISGLALRLLFACITLAVIFLVSTAVGGLAYWAFGRQGSGG